MKTPHPIEIVGWVFTSTVTGFTVAEIADHGVSVLILCTVIGAMLSAGTTLTDSFMKARTTELYRCAIEGCSVEIRATRNHTPQRLAVLKDMPTDHPRHGSAGM